MAKRGRPKKNLSDKLLEVRQKDLQKEKIVSNPFAEKNNNQERRDKLNRIMQEINKIYEDPTMCKFAIDEPPKESLLFGIKTIDEFLGGGAVIGNFIVVYGSEGVGKSTLAYNQIAETQRQGKIAAYIDLEHATSKERMQQFGVNLEELVLIENCENAEQAMDITIKLSKEKVVDLIIIDSIQAMSPKLEQVEGKGERIRSMEEDEMALLARKMGKFLRRTSPFIYKARVAILLIGQVRTGGLGSFVTHETLTGGHGVKHWSMLTVFMRKGQGADAPTEKYVEDGKKKERKVGFDCVFKIEKTKKINSKPELSELHLPFYFKNGFGR